MPRTPLPNGRGRIHVPLIIIALSVALMAVAAVAAVVKLACFIIKQL